MENDLVNIAQFQFVHDIGLTLLQQRLDDEGIEVVMFNENMGSVTPFGTWAAGGIQVRVHRPDAVRAMAIWKEVQTLPDYTDAEEPELAAMRQEEAAIVQRNWNACLYPVVILGTVFLLLRLLGII